MSAIEDSISTKSTCGIRTLNRINFFDIAEHAELAGLTGPAENARLAGLIEHARLAGHAGSHLGPEIAGIQRKMIDQNIRKITGKKEAKTKDGRAWAREEASIHQNGCLSYDAKAGVAAIKEGDKEFLSASAGVHNQAGLGGVIAEAEADATYLKKEDKDGALKLIDGKVEGGLGFGLGGAKANIKAGVDLISAEAKFNGNQSLKTNLGLNVDTGVELGIDGIGASVAGMGFSVGRNMAIKTPFGGINLKLW